MLSYVCHQDEVCDILFDFLGMLDFIKEVDIRVFFE